MDPDTHLALLSVSQYTTSQIIGISKVVILSDPLPVGSGHPTTMAGLHSWEYQPHPTTFGVRRGAKGYVVWQFSRPCL